MIRGDEEKINKSNLVCGQIELISFSIAFDRLRPI